MKVDTKKMNIGAFVVPEGLLLAASGCTESDFGSKYEDPSEVDQVTISNLMIRIFQKVKNCDVYGYERFFGFDSQFVGKYAQTFGYGYSDDMCSPEYTPAIGGQWDNLCSALTQYRKMESLYNEEDDTQEAQNEALVPTAGVQLYDFFAATVDIFGDMPLSKACTLPLTSDVNGSYTPCDKAEDIYKTVLDELEEIAPRFHLVTVPKNFSTQDFINLGNMEKWKRYTDSLRLCFAVRVAAQEALQEEGRAAIREMLKNPAGYPLVEEQEDNIFIISQKSGQPNFIAGNGLGDWTMNRPISGAIIDRMLSHDNYDMNSSDPQNGVYIKGEDDPRILLNYNSVSITNRQTGQVDEHHYLGTDLTVADELTEYYDAQTRDEMDIVNKGFSQITQRGFFWENDKFDMLIMTSPEVHFLKAEAYAVGHGMTQGMSKVEEKFKTAVSQSVTLYYYYDSIGSGENCRRYDVPAPEEIADFAGAKWNSATYADKLDAIITQKWLHFGFLTSREAWSNICRIGYPSELILPEVSDTIPRVPNRWRYPNTEVNYSPYHEDVADKDTYTEELFWAK